MMGNTLRVYAPGLVYCSVCTDAPASQVAALVNEQNPTGLPECPWKIADEDFMDKGQADLRNPHPCERESGFRHFLMVC